jgi:copper transport protein
VARLVLVITMLALALGVPATALGHADLIDTTPADGAVVAQTPDVVTLRFTEPVETALGAVRIFDSQAQEVPIGPPGLSAGGTRLSVPITDDLPNGTYTVSYRVLSADGHPVEGASVFHVGAPGANPEGVASQVGSGASAAVRRASDVARFLDIALVVLLVGAVATILLVFGAHERALANRLWPVVAGLGFGLSVAAGATILLQAAIVQGVGVGGAAQGSVISAVLETDFGRARLAQLILAEVIAIAAVWAPSVGAAWFRWGIGALALALALTPGLSGHASVNGAGVVLADAGHVLAASMWVGGLATVALAIAMAGERRAEVARTLLPRFSTAALVSVGVLLIAGTVGSFSNLESLSDLWGSVYGRLLLAKILIALVLIGFGALSRSAVRRMRRDGDRPPRLRALIGAELALMLVAIGVTSVLVSRAPERALASAASERVAEVAVGDLTARVEVSPARTGPNEVRLRLTDGSGAGAAADEVTVTAAPLAGGVGPFRLIAAAEGDGRYRAGPVQAAAAGPWTFTVAVRRGEFDLQEGRVTIPIEGSVP